jgi:hypothetical protein
MKINSVKDPEMFHREIERRVLLGMDYLEAIVSYCEDNKLEVESVVPLMRNGSVLRAKLQKEAEDLNLVQKSAILPI